MNAGVKGRVGPADKLFQVGIDDRAKAAIMAGPLPDAADRIDEGVVIIAEGEFQPLLLKL
jgi:hypothetical protein